MFRKLLVKLCPIFSSRRLRAVRQDKVQQSERSLDLLQSELQRADDKFKQAVKVAEDGARAAEVQHSLYIESDSWREFQGESVISFNAQNFSLCIKGEAGRDSELRT